MKGKPDNLKPARSVDEARTMGRNGGIKSGETRRKKRDMKKALESLMEMPISNGEEELSAMMEQMGIPKDEQNRMMAILIAMFREAVSGNVKAAEFIRDTIGAGAIAEERKEKIKLERERLELEKARSVQSGEGMPVILNVRPEMPKDVQTAKDDQNEAAATATATD